MKAKLKMLKSPQLLSALLFFALGLGGVLLCVQAYKEHSQQEIRPSSSTEQVQPLFSPQEMRAKFEGTNVAGDYEIIANRNLFHPQRKAWSPPQQEEGNEEQKESTQNRRRARLKQEHFRLFGTTKSAEEEMALIYYQGWPEKSRQRLLQEGQTAYQDQDSEDELFVVAKVDKHSVTLQDNSGNSFEVSLFAHQRQKVKAGAGSGANIVLGGKQEEQVLSRQSQDRQDRQAQAEESRPDSQADSKKTAARDEGPQAAASGPEGAEGQQGEENGEAQEPPKGLQGLLQKLRGGKGKNEQGPPDARGSGQTEKEGGRKIETPFGTVHRPEE